MTEPNTTRAAGEATPAWDHATEGLLREWHDRTAAARSAHYLLASRMRRRNIEVGVPTVIFSAVVGTSLFATLSDANLARPVRVVIGVISLLAAVLAALQTFFGFSQRAERHVIAADWYSAVRRQLEELIALPSGERGSPKECLDGIRKEMSKIGQQAPEIGQDLWSKVAEKHGVVESPKGASGRRR
ncbi:MAG: SLATT domain-containing protein [Actinomycetota bacterium]|nr:SLATT domain-containing protein [Actinomycetota bacterium]MDQ3574872.1 SLATT domain-containing protein [Actinomycetota bacterium]